MERCQASLKTDDWHNIRCSNIAKVQRDGKSYCGIHDPVRLEAIRTANDAKRIRCPNGHTRHAVWWAYCPICGQKYQI